MTPGTKANQNNSLARQQSNPASQEGRRIVGVSARDQVMIEFQRTSLEMAKRFMETQQNVMLAYLGAQGQTNSFNSELIDLAAVQTQSVWTQAPVNYVVANDVQAPAAVMVDHEVSHAAVIKVSEPKGSNHEIVVAPLVAEPKAAPTNGGNGKSSGANAEIVSAVKSGNNGVSASNDTNHGGAAAPDAEQLVASLIDIVSERTGYPPEMLDPELDLEADLGIDSIKRVEILNNFRKLLPESTQSVLEDGIERLAGVKTLSGIIDWIRNDLDLSGSATANTGAINSLSIASAESNQMLRELV